MGIVSFGVKQYYRQFEKGDQKRLAKTVYPKGVEEISNIPYIDDNTKEHVLDIYYPMGAKKDIPVILAFHGGGLFYGYKEINKEHYYMLALKGFVIYSFNYRLIPNVRLSEQFHDVFKAYEWAINNHGNYPGDFDNLFVTGDSAGALLVACSNIINKSTELREIYNINEVNLNPRGLLLVSGMYSLKMGFKFKISKKYFMGKDFKEKKHDAIFKYDELTDIKLPPCYMVTSDQDFMLKQNKMFRNFLEKNDVPHLYHQYPKKKSYRLGHIFVINHPTYIESEEVLNEMKTFVEQNLSHA